MTLIHRRDLLIGGARAGRAAARSPARRQPARPAATQRAADRRHDLPGDARADRGAVLFRSRSWCGATSPRAKPACRCACGCRSSTPPPARRRERARVDIWHCDAAGAYSGYDRERSAGARWLRGTQFADARGGGRVQHPLSRLVRGPGAAHPRQGLAAGRARADLAALFPRRLSDAVYARRAPMRARAGRRLRNGDDGIFRRAGGDVPMAQVAPRGGGYDGAIVIALA